MKKCKCIRGYFNFKGGRIYSIEEHYDLYESKYKIYTEDGYHQVISRVLFNERFKMLTDAEYRHLMLDDILNEEV